MVLSIVYGTVPEKCTASSFLQKPNASLFFSSALSGYVNKSAPDIRLKRLKLYLSKF